MIKFKRNLMLISLITINSIFSLNEKHHLLKIDPGLFNDLYILGQIEDLEKRLKNAKHKPFKRKESPPKKRENLFTKLLNCLNCFKV